MSIRRFHRYRETPSLRRFYQEVRLEAADFIAPLFVHEGIAAPVPVSSMPGVDQWPLSAVASAAQTIADQGISAVLLFGIPSHKDGAASDAFDPKGIVQRAIREIKSKVPSLVIIADCCMCEYTDHGGCAVLKNGTFDNDATLETLAKVALSYAEAGVDIVAPSGMMDGTVQHLRQALDWAGQTRVSLMSYAVKYASAFYGPFRDAAGSSSQFTGDRKHHQIAPTQRIEAINEAIIDVEEGADSLIVKPGLPYLDMIRDTVNRCDLPVIAYQVSGEYAMLKAAAAAGVMDERAAFEECFVAMKRAGASKIISYYATAFWAKGVGLK